MLHEAEFWVALGFFAFLGCGLFGVHRMLIKALDDRAARIKAELDEARKLKDDAAQLLADYRRKRGEAESEAQEIIAGAKAEAGRLATEAKFKIEEFVSRRTKMAEVKIAQAEPQAAADVRAAAADAAVAAAETHSRAAGQRPARRRIDRQGHRRRPQETVEVRPIFTSSIRRGPDRAARPGRLTEPIQNSRDRSPPPSPPVEIRGVRLRPLGTLLLKTEKPGLEFGEKERAVPRACIHKLAAASNDRQRPLYPRKQTKCCGARLNVQLLRSTS